MKQDPASSNSLTGYPGHMMPPKDRINILVVILSLEIGGMEQVVAELVSHVDRTKFNIIIACLESLGPIGRELAAQNINVIHVDKMSSLWSFLYPRNLVRQIHKCGCNVVHVHSGAWHKAAIAARLCGIRNVIYTEHGRFYPDSKLLIFLDRLYAPLTRHVVTVSSRLSDYMNSVVRIPRSKILTIPNGIDVERFRSSRRMPCESDSLQVGTIARLAPVKDIATLIRAMGIVHRYKPGMCLIIVGDGPERSALEALVRQLDLLSVVAFRGYERDIPEILKDIDIFALSSLSEGTSITLLEAMASGKPVVVTNVGGNPEVVEEGVNGLLVPARDPDSLAKALLKIAGNPDLRRSMAEANINKIGKHYSVQSMVRLYEALYRETPC
jgi:L-malate glycosyltransferase